MDATAAVPVNWMVMDDCRPDRRVRYFVIEGSNSLASWQTNLTFQPTLFEEGRLPASPKVRVHSGTYEVSRRLYARLLPLIEQHLASHPKVGLSST